MHSVCVSAGTNAVATQHISKACNSIVQQIINYINVSFCIVLNLYLIQEIVLILLKTIFSRELNEFFRIL